jgi:guanylate kinase
MPCNFVFVKTPSIAELRNRLQARGTETEESLQKRIGVAEQEISQAERSTLFSKVFINDRQEEFLKEAEAYIEKELYAPKQN